MTCQEDEAWDQEVEAKAEGNRQQAITRKVDVVEVDVVEEDVVEEDMVEEDVVEEAEDVDMDVAVVDQLHTSLQQWQVKIS